LTQSDQDRLWGEVISLRNLDEAWARVRSNGGCSGGDGLTVERFQKNAALRLTDLSKALREGTYLPAAIRQVDIPKKKGGHRRLLIPSLLDRILHTAIAQVITPILDPTFEDSSFAYRPGRSVDQAVRTIETWRKEGYWHVIEADIVGYFDAIRHDQLLGKLELALKDHVGSDAVVSIVAHWFEHLAQHTGTLGKGVAQGSPLSPILANLYLDELDEALHGKGVRLVRFADDFVILCKKRKTAEAALEDATKLLADHGLELHRDGTRVIDFDRGFEFLGRLFVRSFVLQSVADPEDDVVSFLRSVDVQDRQAEREATALAATIEGEKAQGYDRGDRVLYLSEPGRKLTLQNLSFSVEAEDGHQLIVLAHDRVDRIEVGTGVVMDANVIRHALASNTKLVFVNGLGETEGWLNTPDTERGALQLAQADAILDADRRLEIARALVEARIRNQRTQLFRLNRNRNSADVTKALASMGRHLRKLEASSSLGELMGIEGVVAAEYWPALGSMCAGVETPFRRTRPAKDPLNATINYLTALLERDIRSALLSAGLHTGFGILHSARDRQDAAIYDLMEPFRAPLNEGLAVYLFNSKRLKQDQFVKTDTGVRIEWKARKAIIAGYEQALAKRVNVTGKKIKLAWRPLMRRQAQDLAKAFRSAEPDLFQAYLMEA